jgi:hypothetical protein
LHLASLVWHPTPQAKPRGTTPNLVGCVMIAFLAGLFRGLSFIFGISAPPPEQSQRWFVFMWLGIIAFLLLFGVVLFYTVSHMHLR